MNSIYISILFYFTFDEKLGLKFITGMLLALFGVSVMTMQKEGSSQAVQEENNGEFAMAIFFGMLTPLIISLFVGVSRYTATKYNYDSTDMHMDTMLFYGIIGCPFMFHWWATIGYTNYQLTCGILSAMANILGLICSNYATNYGLAGPANAIMQVQGVIHVLLSCLFQGAMVTANQYAGILFLIAGGVVMSIDWNFSKLKSMNQDTSDDFE